MRYKKRLKLLKDYFGTTDNVYVQHQLEILDSEIDMSIMDAQIKVMNENLDKIKEL